MQHATQVALVRELLHHLDAGTTAMADGVMRNRVDIYTDPDRFEREWSMIRRAPQFFGLSSRLPAPGSYATDDETGIPVLLARGDDGRVRSFLNVCRHRGSRVASGHGAGGKLVCPYHGWTYDCRGRLAGVPDRRSFDGVDLSDRNLVELPVLELGGMIWSGLAPTAAFDLDRFLAGLGPELASYGFDRHLHYARRTLVRRMNWKMVIDTFLESYHFGVLHPHTVHPLFLANVGLFEPFGPHLRVVYPRRTIAELKDRPESDWGPGDPHRDHLRAVPEHRHRDAGGPRPRSGGSSPTRNGRTRASSISTSTSRSPRRPTARTRHWDRNLDLVLRTVEEEDFPTGEGIQAGFRAGAQTEVVYGRNEPALQHWQRTVTRALEDGAGGG